MIVHRPPILRRPIVRRKSSPWRSPSAPGSVQCIVATTKATSLAAVIVIEVMSKTIGSPEQEKTGPRFSCRLRCPWIEMVGEHRTSRCPKNDFAVSLQNLCDVRRLPRTQPHRELPPRLVSYSASYPSEVPPEIANHLSLPAAPFITTGFQPAGNLPAHPFKTARVSLDLTFLISEIIGKQDRGQ